ERARNPGTQGALRAYQQCLLQPRWQTPGQWQLGSDGEGVGRGEGTGTPHPQGTYRSSEERLLQPRRQAPCQRLQGPDGEGVVSGQGEVRIGRRGWRLFPLNDVAESAAVSLPAAARLDRPQDSPGAAPSGEPPFKLATFGWRTDARRGWGAAEPRQT